MAKRRILLVVSGGIAAYKTPELVRALGRAGHSVRCVLTDAARQFVAPLALQAVSGQTVRSALFDLTDESQIGHIELADWAELVLVAPASADFLAKLAHGLADDLASTLLLATRAPVLVAPAMNVNMWSHPATQANIATLRARGVRTLGPEAGELACGWEGLGRMSEPAEIAAQVELLLAPKSLAGVRVVVTAGGTREPLDPVRAITNRSSGKMGFALAAEAALRGAECVLIAGASTQPTPAGVTRIDVASALDMRAVVLREQASAQVVVMAAAVADFRPASPAERKIKKEDLADGERLTLELVANPDILAEISRDRGERIVVGFAAESHDVRAAARRKLARKGCDLLVANDISRSDAGFETDSNAVLLLTPDGEVEELPLLPKSEVAARIFDRIEKLREGKRA
ncbi:MAG TPA: bifunctional phosphopantothenoylcysteine decarboxylase/phosphopantothenate--cysteine ligase CoaBC [Myxococcota bacterium]|nr:bifunctional phosphopantothenoylcysteine decarboxylase/phosphopantothenate--cysteine ligase CoaBC [Myxococcota bacterium]